MTSIATHLDIQSHTLWVYTVCKLLQVWKVIPDKACTFVSQRLQVFPDEKWQHPHC